MGKKYIDIHSFILRSIEQFFKCIMCIYMYYMYAFMPVFYYCDNVINFELL